MSDPNSRDTKSDTRPIPPVPPEMPDEAPTRSQQPSDRTRAMSAVNPPSSHIPPPPPPRPMAHTGERPKRGQRPAPPRKADSGFYLPLWSIGLMLVGVAMTVGCFVLLVLSLGGRQTPAASAPRFVIITAQPTLPGQETLPVLLVSPTLPEGFGPGFQGTVPAFALQGPTLPPIVLTPTPVALAVGAQVIVVDAGSSGLNVRSGASRDNAVQFIAKEGEMFTVVGGPEQSADGLVWWQVQDPLDTNRKGWAASNYLKVVPTS